MTTHLRVLNDAPFLEGRSTKDAESIGIPIEVLSFNTGNRTSCSEEKRIIHIRGDILPDMENGTSARDRMSSRAVLAHEYYGHYLNMPSQFDIGDWRDEFRASYSAAINAPNLSDEERAMLIQDAYDRAEEAGIKVKKNKKAREILYGFE